VVVVWILCHSVSSVRKTWKPTPSQGPGPAAQCEDGPVHRVQAEAGKLFRKRKAGGELGAEMLRALDGVDGMQGRHSEDVQCSPGSIQKQRAEHSAGRETEDGCKDQKQRNRDKSIRQFRAKLPRRKISVAYVAKSCVQSAASLRPLSQFLTGSLATQDSTQRNPLVNRTKTSGFPGWQA